MNRRRIIIAAVVFIFAGLMIYAFANPATTNNAGDGNNGNTPGETENNGENGKQIEKVVGEDVQLKKKYKSICS